MHDPDTGSSIETLKKVTGMSDEEFKKVRIDSTREYIKEHMNKMPEANKALFKMMNKQAGLSNAEAVTISIDDVVDTMSDERVKQVFKSMFLSTNALVE